MPYPDELLYSVIARYHIRSGNLSPKSTIEELFSSRTASSIADMPCNIDILIKKVPVFMKLKAEQLIQENTLYPYYMVFQTNDKCSEIMQAMRGAYGGDIHTKVGIMASSVKSPENLRFCHKCMETDLKVYGEYYWHRIHQVPGVIVCPEHGVFIQDSTVNLLKTNKHKFIAADDTNCINRSSVNHSSIVTARLYELSKDIQWIFNNFKKVRCSSNFKNGLRNSYLYVLKNKGLATTNGRVYQAEFCNDFISFYQDSFLSIVQSSIGSNYEDSWVASILRKHRKAFHPLRHLLLIRYLIGSVDSFFVETENYLPFGNGPWPCLNPIATHYKSFVVKELTITHCADTKLPVGTFKCECGFVYSRRGPDKTASDIYKIGRIKKFGVEWEQKLTLLSKKKELSLREIARQMGCDVNTVKKYISVLKKPDNIADADTCTIDNLYTAHDPNVQQIHRNIWLNLIKQNPNMSKTQLRQLAKASFVWLYRHDRQWLNENSPKICKERQDYKKIDWEKRDKNTLEQAKIAVKELLASKEKPQKLTISGIGKRIGLLSLLEKHIDKIPETKAFIESVIENDAEYRKRRVIWAVHMLNASGEELKEWKILRKAGIRTEYYEEVKATIKKETEVIS
jgi:hypothetical protein